MSLQSCFPIHVSSHGPSAILEVQRSGNSREPPVIRKCILTEIFYAVGFLTLIYMTSKYQQWRFCVPHFPLLHVRPGGTW